MGQNKELGHLYVFKLDERDIYKVGVTGKEKYHVSQRLNGIRNGCPFAVLPIAAFLVRLPYEVERYLHKQLKPFRLRGEWFTLSDKVVSLLLGRLADVSITCRCSTICRREYSPRLKFAYMTREEEASYKLLLSRYKEVVA